ncbi:hypothetical protein D4T97_005225 [Siminovitchia acidinfaciens]|uniref:Uncharacterized protein n=1 Tax=Siminovitchia acidinfaciens TaxID=2321395 RepID=A0A429Y427_9BACI|nr:hypothetical protein [Siminovitchia acidinfaciens]RST76186.1 hypothetical protein D4T97_005225 [Siminovitchia acidinfaciens]
MDFIENLIKEINNLDEKNYNSFILYAFDYHRRYLKRNKLRMRDFKDQIELFLSSTSKKISKANINSFLYALAKINSQEGLNSISGEKIQWRSKTEELLSFSLETDLPLYVDLSHLDKENIKKIERILTKLVIASIGTTKEETNERLNIMDEFIKNYIGYNDLNN